MYLIAKNSFEQIFHACDLDFNNVENGLYLALLWSFFEGLTERIPVYASDRITFTHITWGKCGLQLWMRP